MILQFVPQQVLPHAYHFLHRTLWQFGDREMRMPTHTASITNLANPMVYTLVRAGLLLAILVEGLHECEALSNAGQTG